MLSHEAAGLAAIRALYAEPIVYTGAGLVGVTISAIKSDVAAEDFTGAGRTLRRISFEVEQADLPSEPKKTDTIVHDGTTYRVNDITPRADIAAWELVVQS